MDSHLPTTPPPYDVHDTPTLQGGGGGERLISCSCVQGGVLSTEGSPLNGRSLSGSQSLSQALGSSVETRLPPLNPCRIHTKSKHRGTKNVLWGVL